MLEHSIYLKFKPNQTLVNKRIYLKNKDISAEIRFNLHI